MGCLGPQCPRLYVLSVAARDPFATVPTGPMSLHAFPRGSESRQRNTARPDRPLVVSKSLISDAYLELATNIRKPAVDLRNLNVVARQKENPKVVTERRSLAFDSEDLKGATGARHEETICFGGPDAPSKLPHVRHQLVLSCHDCQLYQRAFRGVAVRQFFSHHPFRCR